MDLSGGMRGWGDAGDSEGPSEDGRRWRERGWGDGLVGPGGCEGHGDGLVERRAGRATVWWRARVGRWSGGEGRWRGKGDGLVVWRWHKVVGRAGVAKSTFPSGFIGAFRARGSGYWVHRWVRFGVQGTSVRSVVGSGSKVRFAPMIIRWAWTPSWSSGRCRGWSTRRCRTAKLSWCLRSGAHA